MSGGYPNLGGVCNGTDQGTDTANSRGTAVATGTTAGVYNTSYTQIVGSSAVDASLIKISISGGNFNTSNNIIVKIGVGAASSEIDVIKDLMFYNGSTGSNIAVYALPVAIPAGTRISANAAGSGSGTADTVYVQVTLFDSTYGQGEGCAGVDSIGQSAAKGTSIISGAANTKGSFTQLTGSTARDYCGLFFANDGLGSASTPNTGMLWDIGIGPNPSEVTIIPNWAMANTGGNFANNGQVSPIFPIQIPAGTRIAAKFQCVTATQTTGLTCYGLYQ